MGTDELHHDATDEPESDYDAGRRRGWDDGYQAGLQAGTRVGRDQAAADIRRHADRHAPADRPGAASRRRWLITAARIAAGPPTTAEVAQALDDGHAVWCHLDDAGRAIEPHGTAEAPSATQERPAGLGADTEPHRADSEAQRGAEAITRAWLDRPYPERGPQRLDGAGRG